MAELRLHKPAIRNRALAPTTASRSPSPVPLRCTGEENRLDSRRGFGDQLRMTFEDRWWTSQDGLRLHARDHAATDGGPDAGKLPVVCLHGLTRNARDFEDLAPWIAARGRRVIAMSVRGRGQSGRDPQPLNYHPGTYAQDVLAGLESLGVSRAVFVGTSLGGLVTMVLSAIKGEAVAAAVLNDVGPELNPEAIARIGAYVGQTPSIANWAEAADYVRGTNGLAFPAHAGNAGFWNTFARRLFRSDEAGNPVLDYDPDISAPFRQAPTGPAPDLWPLFAGLAKDRPLLLIRGAISDLLLSEAAAKMRQVAPAMTVVEVPNVGHAPNLDEPEALAAIDTFLGQVA